MNNIKDILRRGVDATLYPLPFKHGGKIHIKPENKGKFTASAKKAGESVQQHARSVLNNPNASPLQKKRANFARNAAKWKHQDGGKLPTSFGEIGDRMSSAYQASPTIAGGIGSALWSGASDMGNLFIGAVKSPFQGDNFSRTMKFTGQQIQQGAENAVPKLFPGSVMAKRAEAQRRLTDPTFATRPGVTPTKAQGGSLKPTPYNEMSPGGSSSGLGGRVPASGTVAPPLLMYNSLLDPVGEAIKKALSKTYSDADVDKGRKGMKFTKPGMPAKKPIARTKFANSHFGDKTVKPA